MCEYSEMIFSEDNYNNDNEMWNDIQTFIKIILSQGYIFKMYCDSKTFGIYVIQYGYGDMNLTLEWTNNNESID